MAMLILSTISVYVSLPVLDFISMKIYADVENVMFIFALL